MAGTDGSGYSEKQEELIAYLTSPRTADELRDHLYETDATTGAVRGLISRINHQHDQRVIEYDAEGAYYYWAGNMEILYSLSARAKQTKTRHVNEYRMEKERELKQVLGTTQPAVAPQHPDPSHEDIVFFLTDLHYGDEVIDPETGETLYDFDIADDGVDQIVREGLQHYRRAQAHTEFDTAHLVLGGDICTGEVIYDHQWVHIEGTLDEQVERARRKLWWAISTLADEFDTVQVVCQPGNHGRSKARGSSPQANTDNQLYGDLDAMTRVSEYENVHFVRNKHNAHYVNFGVRGGALKGHLRHGQHAPSHVDATAASSRDWRGWMYMHEFDFAMKGHIHQLQSEMAMDVPVITGGSPKPPSEFAERISAWGAPAAVVFGVSDTEVPTWTRPIYF